MEQVIRVAVVEDDDSTRESLIALIDQAPGFRCVSSWATGNDALRNLPSSRPDVVLMDIRLPDLSGIECTRRLKTELPQVQFVMLTVFEDDKPVFEALSAGATGYILKRTPPAELLNAIANVRAGGSPMSSQIARKVVRSFRNVVGDAPDHPPLSPRENQILSLLSEGYRYKEVADRLTISIDTVRGHVRRIYEKLQVHSRTEAVVRYYGKPGSAGPPGVRSD